MEQKSGVYAIFNRLNCHLYIGSSIQIHKRWYQHRTSLKKGIHHSPYLQRAWNKYGAENFIFEILELTSREEAVIREEYWCRELSPEYNAKAPDPRRSGWTQTEEAKAKVGAASRARGARPPSRKGTKLTPEQIAQREETKRQRGTSGKNQGGSAISEMKKAWWAKAKANGYISPKKGRTATQKG